MSRLIFVNRVCWPAEEATAQLLINLVDGLANRGWECHIITESAGASRRNGNSIIFHRLNPQKTARKTNLLSKALAYRRFSARAEQCLESIVQPRDRVIVMTDPPLIGVKLAAVIHRHDAELWHWAQDIYPEVAIALTPNFLIKLGLKRLLPRRNRSWQAAEHIVTIGQDMAELIRNQVAPPAKVSIQPNWYPASVTGRSDIDFRSQWGVSDEHLLVCYSGNLGRAHTLEPILDIARQVRESPRIQFVLIGDGAQKVSLMRRVAQTGLKNVSFKPPVPRMELDALLQAADVHLVTMRPECRGTVLPSKFYGILSAARPCLFIGPIESDMAQLISRHQLGKACDPTDVTAMASYLLKLAANPSSAKTARELVRKYQHTLPGLPQAVDTWDGLLRRNLP